MANNCLQTKLKGVVQNNYLGKLGEIRFLLNDFSSKLKLQIYGTDDIGTLSIIGHGHFYDSQDNDLGQSLVKDMANTVYYVNNTEQGDILCVEDKYALRALKFPDVSQMLVSGQEISVDYLNALNAFYINRNQLKVNLNILASYAKNLSNIRVVYNSYVTGSIEQIVENLISIGRTSGSLSVYAYRCPILFHGEQFFMTQPTDGTMTISFSGSTATVTYGGNTIATYNGATWTYSN